MRGRCVEPVYEIEGPFQIAVAAPCSGVLAREQVTIVRDQRRHPRRVRGLHITLRITHVDALVGQSPGEFRGVEQGQGMRFAFGQRIAAHHAVEARAESQLLEQRFREPRGLVGDDSRLQAARGERIEHRVHAGKELRASTQRASVNVQETPLQGGKAIGCRIGKTRPHHARGTVAHRGAHQLVRQRRQAFLPAQYIQCADHVGRGVEQCAVEIE